MLTTTSCGNKSLFLYSICNDLFESTSSTTYLSFWRASLLFSVYKNQYTMLYKRKHNNKEVSTIEKNLAAKVSNSTEKIIDYCPVDKTLRDKFYYSAELFANVNVALPSTPKIVVCKILKDDNEWRLPQRCEFCPCN